MSIKVLRLKY
jgi:hypothetical protein